MKYLKQALILVFVIDVLIFLAYQINPDILSYFFPQFNIASSGNAYPRLVGILALAFGIMRLYGAMYIHEKGAVLISMWSWIIELFYILSEIIFNQFIVAENILALVFAPLMFFWTLFYYKNNF